MAGLLAQLKALGLSDAQIAATTIDGKPFHEATATTKQHRYGRYKSKTEAIYAAELDAQLRAGEIDAWDYECWTFRLTDSLEVTKEDGTTKTIPGMRYTPDFVLILPNRRIRIIEVKGYPRDDAIAKYKMAVDKWPCFEWQMVRRKGSGWETIL
jgi:hypothetical protein